MSKAHEQNRLARRTLFRSLLSFSVATSMVVLGCTVNHTMSRSPSLRSVQELPAQASAMTSASENSPVIRPAKASRSVSRADAAAAILAQSQPLRGRYLGVVNPGNRPYVSAQQQQTGQSVYPPVTNPQVTVNATISSNPTEAISSGADAGAVNPGAAISSAIIATAPVAASSALPSGTFASAGTVSPVMAGSGIPTVTGASAGLGRAATVASSSSAVTAATTAAATVTPMVNASAPIQVVRDRGSITVTNVNNPSGNR